MKKVIPTVTSKTTTANALNAPKRFTPEEVAAIDKKISEILSKRGERKGKSD